MFFKMKSVTFDESKNQIFRMHVWQFAYNKARKSEWEQQARDRVRFYRRIEQSDTILSRVLCEEHRSKIVQNNSVFG